MLGLFNNYGDSSMLKNSPTIVGLFYNYDGPYIPDGAQELNLSSKILFFKLNICLKIL